MADGTVCPACNNEFGSTATIQKGSWGYRADCPTCGRFDVAAEADEDFLDPNSHIGSKLTRIQRAHIAHKLRSASVMGPSGLPHLTSAFLESFISQGCPGPTPSEQVTRAIRYVGDEQNRTGERLKNLPQYFFAVIGAANSESANELLIEIKDHNLIDGIVRAPNGELLDIKLTLAGWDAFEAERKGRASGNYGFIAMEFGDLILDPLVRDVIKPTIKSELAYDVFDMRDTARAGVIDNIMRAQIRDAAFVLVDLTHDNSGAYWEAGYAEGLGKPVIYICEKDKFDSAKTHFDTNHCTTVVWDCADFDPFKQQLVATIRRSLNLF